jgi:hypothetical protein
MPRQLSQPAKLVYSWRSRRITSLQFPVRIHRISIRLTCVPQLRLVLHPIMKVLTQILQERSVLVDKA